MNDKKQYHKTEKVRKLLEIELIKYSKNVLVNRLSRWVSVGINCNISLKNTTKIELVDYILKFHWRYMMFQLKNTPFFEHCLKALSLSRSQLITILSRIKPYNIKVKDIRKHYSSIIRFKESGLTIIKIKDGFTYKKMKSNDIKKYIFNRKVDYSNLKLIIKM